MPSNFFNVCKTSTSTATSIVQTSMGVTHTKIRPGIVSKFNIITDNNNTNRQTQMLNPTDESLNYQVCDETDNNNTNKIPNGSPAQIITVPTHPDENIGVYKVDELLRELRPNIEVSKFKTWIDKKQLTIDERSSVVLKYITPHFR